MPEPQSVPVAYTKYRPGDSAELAARRARAEHHNELADRWLEDNAAFVASLSTGTVLKSRRVNVFVATEPPPRRAPDDPIVLLGTKLIDSHRLTIDFTHNTLEIVRAD